MNLCKGSTAALLALVADASVLYGQTLAKSANSPVPPDTLKTTVEQIVREYILQHPDILMESLRGFQERARAGEAEKARAAISQRKHELAADSLTPVAGNQTSGVTLTFFFDYRCGYCKKVTHNLLAFTQADSPVRVIFKELPILGPESETAARAALAAAKQGAYLTMHQALMAHQGAFTAEAMEEVARVAKLDVAQWKTDLTSPEVDRAIRANQDLASTIGVQATPSFVAGSELAAGALDAKGFAALIERAKAQPQAVAAAK